MLKEAAGVRRVVLKMGRTDLRRGIDGLKAVISLNGMDPLEIGTLYLFCGTRNDRIRGLLYEGDGFLLVTKRLSGENRFQWPRSAEDLKQITRKPKQYISFQEVVFVLCLPSAFRLPLIMLAVPTTPSELSAA